MGTSQGPVDPMIDNPLADDRARSYGVGHAGTRNVSGSTRTDGVRGENSDEIREDIADTRDRMDETLDELGNRLSPKRLIDEAMHLFSGPTARNTASRAGDTAVEFTENLGRVVRDNPVPTLLIGAGLAWLAFGGSSSDSRASSRSEPPRRRKATREPRYEDFYEDDYGPDIPYGTLAYAEFEDEMYYDDPFARGEFVEDEDVWDIDDYRETMSGGTGATARRATMDENATEEESEGIVSKVAGAASSAGHAVSDAAASVAGKVKDAASATASAVSSAASQAKSGVVHAEEAVADRARRAMRSGRRTGASAYRYGGQARRSVSRGLAHQGEHAMDLYQYAARRYSAASEAYPLAVGMGCMALGMLSGLLAPRTRYEDDLMGDASDELKDDMRETGEQVMERGKRAVSGAISEAEQSAEEHGLTGSSLLERGERVAAKVVSAASDALKQEHLTPKELAQDAKAVGKDAADKLRAEAGEMAEDAKTQVGKADPDLKRSVDKQSASGSTGTSANTGNTGAMGTSVKTPSGKPAEANPVAPIKTQACETPASKAGESKSNESTGVPGRSNPNAPRSIDRMNE